MPEPGSTPRHDREYVWIQPMPCLWRNQGEFKGSIAGRYSLTDSAYRGHKALSHEMASRWVRLPGGVLAKI
jgi:hypothetical protein